MNKVNDWIVLYRRRLILFVASANLLEGICYLLAVLQRTSARVKSSRRYSASAMMGESSGLTMFRGAAGSFRSRIYRPYALASFTGVHRHKTYNYQRAVVVCSRLARHR